MNGGDVFVLDAGLKIWQWNGSKSSGFERNKGQTMVTGIVSERPKASSIVISIMTIYNAFIL